MCVMMMRESEMSGVLCMYEEDDRGILTLNCSTGGLLTWHPSVVYDIAKP